MRKYLNKSQEPRIIQKSKEHSTKTRNILSISSTQWKVPSINSNIVCQKVGQDEVEKVIAEKLGIRKEIEEYGGLCGGWSMMLIRNPDKALKMWKSLEELYYKKKLNPHNIKKKMIEFFIKTMKFQYELSINDAKFENAANVGFLIDNIAILHDALEKKDIRKDDMMQSYINIQQMYDIENFNIKDKSDWVDLKYYVDHYGAVIIATNNHFMSIKKDTAVIGPREKYYVSETNSNGYSYVHWGKISKILNHELKAANYVINIKYSDL